MTPMHAISDTAVTASLNSCLNRRFSLSCFACSVVKGDKIAFVCRSENRHQVFVTNTDGTQPVQLTTRGSNEDPSWSPDGRYLVFSSTAFGSSKSLAMIRADGANMVSLYESRSGSFDPAWSGWSR